MRSILTWATPVLFAIATGTVGAGCSSESEYCEAFCECEQCDDRGADACKAQLSSTRSYAEDNNCGTEYEAYIDCLALRGTCVDQTFETVGCEDANDAFSICLGGDPGE